MPIQNFYVDNIKIESSVACATHDGFINGDFKNLAIGWRYPGPDSKSKISYPLIDGKTFARIQSAQCGTLSQSFFIPNDDSVNAIQYTYHFPKNDQTKAHIYASAATSNETFYINKNLPVTASPKTVKYCLPDGAKGRPWTLNLNTRTTDSKNSFCSDTITKAALSVTGIKLIKMDCPINAK